MRPTGGLTAQLPANVEVDTSPAHNALSPDLPCTGPEVAPRGGSEKPRVRQLNRGQPEQAAAGRCGCWVGSAGIAGRTASRRLPVGEDDQPTRCRLYVSGCSGIGGLRRAWPGVPLITRAHGGDVAIANMAGRRSRNRANKSMLQIESLVYQMRDYLSKRFPQRSFCIRDQTPRGRRYRWTLHALIRQKRSEF